MIQKGAVSGETLRAEPPYAVQALKRACPVKQVCSLREADHQHCDLFCRVLADILVNEAGERNRVKGVSIIIRIMIMESQVVIRGCTIRYALIHYTAQGLKAVFN